MIKKRESKNPSSLQKARLPSGETVWVRARSDDFVTIENIPITDTGYEYGDVVLLTLDGDGFPLISELIRKAHYLTEFVKATEDENELRVLAKTLESEGAVYENVAGGIIVISAKPKQWPSVRRILKERNIRGLILSKEEATDLASEPCGKTQAERFKDASPIGIKKSRK